jgi:hypothetical protein
VIFYSSTAAAGEPFLNIEWERMYGNTDDGMYNVLNRIERTTDGNLILAGNTANYDGEGGLFYLARTDSSGQLIWQRDFGRGEARWVDPTSDGGYVLAGIEGPLVVKTDAEGDPIWEARGRVQMRAASCVRQTSDSGFVVGGIMVPEDRNGQEVLIRLDPAGQILWEKSYGEGSIFSVLESRDGGLVFLGTGVREFNFSRDRIHIAKTDASGVIQWEKFFAPKAARIDAGFASDEAYGQGGLVETAEGDLVVCGWGHIHADRRHCGTVLWLDASGNLLWQRDLWSPGEDHSLYYLWSLGLARDGGILVAGQTDDPHTYVARLEANGDLEWEGIFFECDGGRSILETEDGGYLVAGAQDLYAYLVKVRPGAAAASKFRRGDVNGDGEIDIADSIHLLYHLFAESTRPGCLDAADLDDGGTLDLSDAIYGLVHLFLGGLPPRPPHPDCGFDSTIDDLTCEVTRCGD